MQVCYWKELNSILFHNYGCFDLLELSLVIRQSARSPWGMDIHELPVASHSMNAVSLAPIRALHTHGDVSFLPSG